MSIQNFEHCTFMNRVQYFLSLILWHIVESIPKVLEQILKAKFLFFYSFTHDCDICGHLTTLFLSFLLSGDLKLQILPFLPLIPWWSWVLKHEREQPIWAISWRWPTKHIYCSLLMEWEGLRWLVVYASKRHIQSSWVLGMLSILLLGH